MADPRQHLYEEGLEVNRQHEGLEVNQSFVADKPPSTNYGPELRVARRQSERSSRNPWGLGPVAFGLLIGIITAIFVGAAVGGGVAGSMKSRKNSCPPPVSSVNSSAATATVTTTATVPTMPASQSAALLTNYSAPAPSAISWLFLNCPALNGLTYTNAFTGDKYAQFCGQDFTSGLPAEGGGVISDIAGIIAYSANDCMDACSKTNSLAARWNDGIQCRAITFSIDLHNATIAQGANCFLKNATIASGTQGNVNDHALSATLA